jgi:hypothetical protein
VGYWEELINQHQKKIVALFFGMSMLLAGCAKEQEGTETLTDVVAESTVPGETDKDCEAGNMHEQQGEVIEIGSYDFTEHIEKKHKILKYDICSEPKYDYENTPLEECLTEDIESNRKLREKLPDNTLLKIDYHLFDFNDDGLEDYLVCLSSSEYCGSAGNMVRIYIQEADGRLSEALSITMRLINSDNPTGHEAFTVLNEKTDGYYAIVTIFYNRILRHDRETGKYEFHNGE